MTGIVVRDDVCDLCGTCLGVCPTNCMELTETRLRIDTEQCILCELCVKICPVDALERRDGQLL
ncbi:MAG: 4Fe-4S binding protein [candidate division KSB1 bacterium]|nr:4Fe-4S binding protein [candidate division KSB1 bacterium]